MVSLNKTVKKKKKKKNDKYIKSVLHKAKKKMIGKV